MIQGAIGDLTGCKNLCSPRLLSVSNGALEKVVSGGNSQLLLDVGAVRFDRFDADVESFGDLLGAIPLPDQGKHLYFAIAQGAPLVLTG